MKNGLKVVAAVAALSFFAAAPVMAKGGKGEGAVHSNAPSTGSQEKGKARAEEVGKGKKKGLHKHHNHPVKKKHTETK